MSLTRSLVISLIVLSNLGSALTIPLIYLDFEVRRDYISKVLCINREKPITVCGGSCYLSDQLKKTQKQQDEQKTATPKPITFFAKEILPIILTDNTASDCQPNDHNIYNEGLLPSLFTGSIFHPPRLV